MKIIAKPNKKKTRLIGQDKQGNYVIELNARPENNQANIELIRFLSKNKKLNPDYRTVKIIKGLKSKKKVVRFF